MAAPLVSIAELNAFNARSPYNTWLGIRVLAASDSEAEIEVPWRDEFVGDWTTGSMHGGVLAAIVDVAGGMALIAAIGRPGPAIDIRTDFHRAVKAGTLRGVGRILRAGTSITTAEALLYDDQRRLVASGRCVYFTLQR